MGGDAFDDEVQHGLALLARRVRDAHESLRESLTEARARLKALGEPTTDLRTRSRALVMLRAAPRRAKRALGRSGRRAGRSATLAVSTRSERQHAESQCK